MGWDHVSQGRFSASIMVLFAQTGALGRQSLLIVVSTAAKEAVAVLVAQVLQGQRQALGSLRQSKNRSAPVSHQVDPSVAGRHSLRAAAAS